MPTSIKTSKIIIQVYGWLMIVLAALAIVFSFLLVIIVLIGGISEGEVEEALTAGLIIFIMFIMGIFLFAAIGFILLKTAKAIEQRESWGKIVGIIWAVMIIFSFPIGTLAGIFIMVGLLSHETDEWFE